jgi:hypothetical protein
VHRFRLWPVVSIFVLGAGIATAQPTTAPQPKLPPGQTEKGQDSKSKPEGEKADEPKEGEGTPLSIPTAGPEAEDPEFVALITGLQALTQEHSKTIATRVRDLRDEATFAVAVKEILNALKSEKDPLGIGESEKDWTAGKFGPHLLIHVVAVDDTQLAKTKMARLTDKWYVWRDGISFSEYTGTRLFGISKFHVLSLVGPVTAAAVEADIAQVEYKAILKRKQPLNVSNLLRILKVAGISAQGKSSTFYAGFGTADKVPPTSDVTVAAYIREAKNQAQLRRVGTKAVFDNEGLHWWDVSVGFPINRIKELEFNEAANILQPKTVDKSTVLVLADLYFRPTDLKNVGKTWSPAIGVGIALTGKVRESLFVGLTSNLPPIRSLAFTRSGWYQAFRPYIGVQLVNADRAIQNPPPGGPTTEQRTVGKLAIGINIPVLSTIDRLTEKPKETEEAKNAKPKADSTDTSKKEPKTGPEKK